MDRRLRAVMLVRFSALLVAGCVSTAPTAPPGSDVSSTLPASKLTEYNDSFDSVRDDLYDRLATTYNKEQLANFKLADMTIEAGQLVIRTQTGCFSKGGLASRYTLRGDFDVQIDCHIVDFSRVAADMDQVLAFGLFPRKNERDYYVAMWVSRSSKASKSFIGCRSVMGGNFNNGNAEQIDDFHGKLRAVRKDKKVAVLYKKTTENKWHELDSFKFVTEDVAVTFVLQNFSEKRISIEAPAPITARFDNLIINSAQDIVEGEI